MTESKTPASSGYAQGQLSRALQTAATHADPEVQRQAQEKATRWEQVFRGMLNGVLAVGSRTPVEGAASWVTLEVVQGGFASGNFAAGGPLQPHEVDLLGRLPTREGESQRGTLNIYYLSEAGQAELYDLLVTGRYRVNVPEEGALLTVAWLASRNQVERAHALLDQIAPYFDRLRFYPAPSDLPLLPSPLVKRQTIGEVVKNLRKGRTQPHLERMNEALGVWLPLYDRALELFLETVEGAPPSLKRDAQGELVRQSTGQPICEGGWPCQHYPQGWSARATSLLQDYERLRGAHPLCKKPERTKENFARLRNAMRRALTDPKELTGREVGMVRKILASSASRHGAPGSPRRQQLRERQVRTAAAPLHTELRGVLVRRLSALPPDGGLGSMEPVHAPVSAEELASAGNSLVFCLPEYLQRKAERCWLAPVETLVQRGVIPSGEVLAQVLPQITSQVRAAGIADPDLRRLYGAVYSAFRRRRSLLLLNLEHQVQVGELPWVEAMEAQRGAGLQETELARQTFEQLATLSLTAFPHAIFPNKLLQEFKALAATANLKLPFVEELAADIFMGSFTGKWLAATQIAARLLQGTLYERYYGIPYALLLSASAESASPGGTQRSELFSKLCSKLAGPGSRAGVAANGKVIEQSQVLTTQNLAAVFDAKGIRLSLRGRLGDLAGQTFDWVCRQQAMKIARWSAKLQSIKNSAYAWRQMIFYLSLLDAAALTAFLATARKRLEASPADFQQRFLPAFEGLVFVAQGGSFDADGRAGTTGEFRRFLGWTTERHWLLGPDPRPTS